MTNFKLIIKNADGSVYWSENFESKKDLNFWLNAEKTRPYWKKEFTTEIVDSSKENAEREKQLSDRAKVEEEKRNAVVLELKKFRKIKKPTAEELAQAMMNLLSIVGIEDDVTELKK